MYDDIFAMVPAEPPRRTTLLPGLRLGAIVSRSTLLLPLAFFVLFAFIPFSILQSDPKMRLALGTSGNASGRIVNVSEVRNSQQGPGHRIVYIFSVQPGRELRGASVVGEVSPYYSAQPGDAIDIQFLVRDPSVNAPSGMRDRNAPPIAFLFVFPLFVLMFFVPMFLPLVREIWRARRLFAKGRVTTARVIFVKRRTSMRWPGWPGSTSSEVFLEYQRVAGDRAEALALCSNDWILNQLAPEAIVHIAYQEEVPERAALLDAYLR
jgi:hypothetical protein